MRETLKWLSLILNIIKDVCEVLDAFDKCFVDILSTLLIYTVYLS